MGAASIQSVRHHLNCVRGSGQLDGFHFRSVDVNAVVSHSKADYAFVDKKVTFAEKILSLVRKMQQC